MQKREIVSPFWKLTHDPIVSIVETIVILFKAKNVLKTIVLHISLSLLNQVHTWRYRQNIPRENDRKTHFNTSSTMKELNSFSTQHRFKSWSRRFGEGWSLAKICQCCLLSLSNSSSLSEYRKFVFRSFSLGMFQTLVLHILLPALLYDTPT